MRSLRWWSLSCLLLACGASHEPEALTPLDGVDHLLLHAGVLYAPTFGGDLMAVPTDGGTPTPFARQQPTSNLAADDTQLYWGNYYFSQTESRTELMGAPFSGGAPTLLAPGPVSLGLAVGGGSLYWITNELAEGDPPDLGGSVRRVAVGGGAPEIIASGLSPTAIAADSTGIFYADDQDVFNDQVVFLPGGDGAPVVVGTGLSGLGGVSEIVPTKDDLVLVTATGGGATVHNLKALPRAGGDARLLSLGIDCPVVLGIAAEPPDVYVSCQKLGGVSLERTSLEGGEAEVLATFSEPDGGGSVDAITNPVLDATAVYVGAYGTVYRIAK
jgi:hypothetical protein